MSAAIALLVAAACMQVLAAYIGDKTWLLLAANMMLGGKKLYVDIMEVNPPLILWLYTLPVWVSLHVPLKDYHVLGLMGLGFCALSTWLSTLLIKPHPFFSGDARRQKLFTLGLLLLFIFFTRPGYFFDREHIFFVLTFPYMLRFMPSLDDKLVSLRLRIAIGALAALGFCMKPYTLLMFAALQLLVMFRRRSCAILWSVENGIIYILALLYLFCVLRFTPEYREVVIPMAVATYSAFSRRNFGIFYFIVAFVCAGVTFADFRTRYSTPLRRDIYYFAGIALSFFAYALVNNGWGYTYHPLLCQVLFLSGWVGCEYRWLRREYQGQGESVKQFIFGERGSAIVLIVNAAFMAWWMAGFYLTPACKWAPECEDNQPYARYIEEHHIRSFGALSEDFPKWASLARLTGARFDTRYNALWMVPGLAKEDAETRRKQWIVDTVGRGLAQDLNTRKPEIVFVDDSRDFFDLGLDLNLAEFFSVVPEFKAAWSHYRFADRIDRCRAMGNAGQKQAACRYDIYSRMP